MKFLISFALTILIQSSESEFDIDWATVTDQTATVAPLTTPPAQNDPPIGRIAPSIIHFPHQIRIITKTSATGLFSCGGAIISKDYVLTAAHCLKPVTEGYIYIGCLNPRIVTGNCKKFTLTISNFIIHPGYDDKTYANDIALIKLPSSITYSASTNKSDIYKDVVKPTDKLVVSGWGRSENDVRPDVLTYAYGKVIDDKTCSKFYAVLPTQICQDVKGKACQGDSGGPMSLYKDGKVFLIGITSYGPPPNGCSNEVPRIYTRVQAYNQWIYENAQVT